LPINRNRSKSNIHRKATQESGAEITEQFLRRVQGDETLKRNSRTSEIEVYSPRSRYSEAPSENSKVLTSSETPQKDPLPFPTIELPELLGEMIQNFKLTKTASFSDPVEKPEPVTPRRKSSKERVEEPVTPRRRLVNAKDENEAILKKVAQTERFRMLQEIYGEPKGKEKNVDAEVGQDSVEVIQRKSKKIYKMPPKAESDVSKYFPKDHEEHSPISKTLGKAKGRSKRNEGLITFSQKLPKENFRKKFEKLPYSQNESKYNEKVRNSLNKHLKKRLTSILLQDIQESIWRLINRKTEKICNQKGFLSSKAVEIELQHSPRVKNLIDSIKENKKVIHQIHENMGIIQKYLFELLKDFKFKTHWLETFIDTLDTLIDSSLGSFMKTFTEADTEIRKIIIRGLGEEKERNEIIKLLNSWRDEYVFEKEITENLKAKESYFLSLESLPLREFEVPVKKFAEIFFSIKEIMLENLEQKKIYEIPHYVNKEKLKSSHGGSLKEFLVSLLQVLYRSPSVSVMTPKQVHKQVDGLFALEGIEAEFLLKILHFGHSNFSQLIQKMFPSLINRNSSLEQRCIGCWIEFVDFTDFSMTFEMDYCFNDAAQEEEDLAEHQLPFTGKFIFKLEILPDFKEGELPYMKAVMFIKDYEFAPQLPDETQNRILAEILQYAIPRGSRLSHIHSDTYYTQKGNDKRIQADLEAAIMEISPLPPTENELIDRYKNTCRKEVEKKGEKFSIKNVKKALNMNETFFEAMVPRFRALGEQMAIILERTRSEFSDALVPTIQKIIKGFGDAVSPRKVNPGVDISKFLEIYKTIENPNIRKVVLLMLAKTESEGKKLIRYLESSINFSKIRRTLEAMLSQKEKFETTTLEAKYYLLEPPPGLRAKMLKNRPGQILRSYIPHGKVLFNSIKINSITPPIDLSKRLTQLDFFKTFLIQLYSFLDPERLEGRILEEAKALITFGEVSWKDVVKFFLKNKAKKRIDIDKLKKIFKCSEEQSAAIPWDEIINEWKEFKKHRLTKKQLKKALISWFTLKTCPCYPILGPATIGAWGIVQATFKSTFKEAFEAPFFVVTNLGIDLEIQITNADQYKVCVSKVLGIHARKYRWKEGRTAVDKNKPLAFMDVRAIYNFSQEQCNLLLQFGPPRFIEKNIDFKEDKYRVLDFFENVSKPSVDLTLVSKSFKKKNQEKILFLKQLTQEASQPFFGCFQNEEENNSSAGTDLESLPELDLGLPEYEEYESTENSSD